MSELPSGWAETTLGEVARWGSGGTPRSGTPRYYGGEIPWAVIGDLRDGVVIETATSITTEGLANSSAKVVEAGTVLVAMYGSIGKLGIAGVSMATNQAIAFMRPYTGIEARFLYWLLRWQRPGLATAGKGATQKNISQTILTAWPIAVPPLAEQRRIVAAIEEQFSRLDAVEQALVDATRRADTLRRACLAAACSGDDPSRRLGDVAETQLGKMLSTKSKVGDQPQPYLRNKSVQWYRVDVHDLPTMDFSETERAKFKLLPGDVLVCEGGEVGRAAIWRGELSDCYFQKALHRVRPGPELDGDFLVHVLRWFSDREAFDSYVTGSTIKHLPQEDFRRLPIPLPPLEDQRRIVAELEQQLSLLDSLRAAVESAQQRSAALRRAILERAFRGELVPQDPADEPASVLLERIRAERAAHPAANRRGGVAR